MSTTSAPDMKLHLTHLFHFLGILISSRASDSNTAETATVSPTVQFKPPDTANKAQNVSQGFIGFAIAMQIFAKYGGKQLTRYFASGSHLFQTGIEQPNKFSGNLMSAISSRTGAPIHIRVGGTAMDNSVFMASNDKPITVTTKPSSRAENCPRGCHDVNVGAHAVF
ncbi:hypothetical protein GGX14DRAFT_634145 [Mycena pura]|uniref:Uncharacterized protein n=1 Tax=Mycena pura TaxID=153505 RepID=A0AAD6VCR5_9AGAR|nr:hypothetical protein GGX14DRAFT_634145 [Mycena pura]